MNRRPTNAPNQNQFSRDESYWMAGAPAAMPDHAFGDYLRWLLGTQNALSPGVLPAVPPAWPSGWGDPEESAPSQVRNFNALRVR